MLRWLIVICVLTGAARADARHPPNFDAPPDAIEGYYRGELVGGFTLMGMGLAGLATGGTLLASSDREAVQGAAYPLLGFGAAHLAAGVYINLASIKRLRGFTRTIDHDPETWGALEQARMRKVVTQLRVLTVIEGVGLAAGIGLAVYGHARDRPALTGVGVALAGELAATLIFDLVATRRASRYRRALGGVGF